MAQNQNPQEIIKAFVRTNMSVILKKNQIDGLSNIDALIAETLKTVDTIIKTYSSQKYEFNLAMDFFVQMADSDIGEVFREILERADLSDSDETEIFFGVYYALSIFYKKNDDIEGLKSLLDKKYSAFLVYPLHFEVYSRYYKRIGEYNQALKYDKRAIDILRLRKITNIGLLISYASTVCTMLKQNASPKEDHVKLALTYVNKAMKINPRYPKYPFVKAQLVFLSALRFGEDPAIYAQKRDEAKDLIARADTLLHNNYKNDNHYVKKELSAYEKFQDMMDTTIDSLRFPKSFDELDKVKERLIKEGTHDDCDADDCLPENPELRDGDKYFFVCYSSRDFKSVYCDLIELYKKKIHFKYDHRLISGNSLGWEEDVRKKINHKDCVGVVFFLSKNIFVGDSVHKEIKIAKESDKKNKKLTINLDEKAPSRLMIDYIIEQYEEEKKSYECCECDGRECTKEESECKCTRPEIAPKSHYLSDEQMRTFLEYFPDNIPFAKKQRKHHDEGKRHIKSLIAMIKQAFETPDCKVSGDKSDEIIDI